MPSNQPEPGIDLSKQVPAKRGRGYRPSKDTDRVEQHRAENSERERRRERRVAKKAKQKATATLEQQSATGPVQGEVDSGTLFPTASQATPQGPAQVPYLPPSGTRSYPNIIPNGAQFLGSPRTIVHLPPELEPRLPSVFDAHGINEHRSDQGSLIQGLEDDDDGAGYQRSIEEDLRAVEQPPLREPTVSATTTFPDPISAPSRLHRSALNNMPQGHGTLTREMPSLPSFPSSRATPSASRHRSSPSPLLHTTKSRSSRDSSTSSSTDSSSSESESSESDSSRTSKSANSMKGKVKKRRRTTTRKRKKRIRRFDELEDETEQVIAEEACSIARALVVTEDAFVPTKSDDLDVLCDTAYREACIKLRGVGMNLGRYDTDMPSRNVRYLIEDRVSSARGDVKTAATRELKRYFPFQPCVSDNTAVVQKNRKLFQHLAGAEEQRHHKYFYLDYLNPDTPNTLYKISLIADIINAIWFHGQKALGVRQAALFDDDNDRMPLPVIALVVTAIRGALDEWKLGYRKPTKFTWEAYNGVYKFHTDQLTNWSKLCKENDSNACNEWQKKLLADARLHAGITVEVVAQTGDNARNVNLDNNVLRNNLG